jgi:hypothetical protein
LPNKVISFMFPVTSGVMGGVQTLVMNYVTAMSKRRDVTVRLYDYSMGLIVTKLPQEVKDNIDFVCLDGHDWVIPNKGNETFVLTDFLWQKYPFFFKVKYGVHLLMLDVFYPTWGKFYKAKWFEVPGLKSHTIRLLCDRSAVSFIEEKGLNRFKALSGKADAHTCIIPIPFDTNSARKLVKESATKQRARCLALGYIGRAVNWKIMPVVKLVDDISKIRKQFVLYIYTDNVTEFSRHLNPGDNVTIKYIEGLFGRSLHQHILQHVDVGYSMGTASLEFASLGLSTVMADFSCTPFPKNYRYRWLFEACSGDVGMDVEDITDYDKRHTIETILASDFEKIGLLCSQYVYEVHEIDVVIERLIYKCASTELVPDDLNHFVFYQQLAIYLIKRVVRKNKQFYGWGIK